MALDKIDSRVVELKQGTELTLDAATTSDIGGVPSGARRISLILDGVSTNGSSNLELLLGGATSFVSSGYESSYASGSGGTTGTNTAGFRLTAALSAGNFYSGVVELWSLDGLTWNCKSHIHSGATTIHTCLGKVTLTEELTRFQLTTLTGIQVFDAGTWNWMVG